MRGEVRQVRTPAVRAVCLVGNDDDIAMPRRQLDGKLHPPQRTRRVVGQREEHDARMMRLDRALDRCFVELELRVEWYFDRLDATPDCREAVVHERGRRIENRARTCATDAVLVSRAR